MRPGRRSARCSRRWRQSKKPSSLTRSPASGGGTCSSMAARRGPRPHSPRSPRTLRSSSSAPVLGSGREPSAPSVRTWRRTTTGRRCRRRCVRCRPSWCGEVASRCSARPRRAAAARCCSCTLRPVRWRTRRCLRTAARCCSTWGRREAGTTQTRPSSTCSRRDGGSSECCGSPPSAVATRSCTCASAGRTPSNERLSRAGRCARPRGMM
mmetsp:Transcript_19633/g.63253  ORF Transcript_19633/g.63253 Transcript_19633/m.63253 type:complete len:210 (-) Transcript_19633:123-752(-)